jgi:hypothetical protein
MLGKEEAWGLDGTNLLAGIEAMNLPGHTSIPVRRTQLQRAASDKLVSGQRRSSVRGIAAAAIKGGTVEI